VTVEERSAHLTLKATLRRVRTSALIVLLALLGLAGCGKKATPADGVRAVVTRFGDASAKQDYQQICDQLLARALVKNVEQYGLPCELAFKQGLRGVRAPKLTIGAITVKGDRASARVTTTAANQQPSTDTLALRRADGEWRIAALDS